ncbi:o-succinylbenzoate--CoA ligase [Bacillus sp. REN10]|uniref:o-succinylbenzoate--CoA ligase n=1 Tax=Bacillus sp. REN10 TaxID=2782541 RepID=UPI00193B8736|nr:o-succinylbenzoate--CoA ligase [Bacillus sp. REN10]
MKQISTWIEKRASMSPDRLALLDLRRRLTYFEMNNEMNRLAYYLRKIEMLQQGDRIGLYFNNRIDYILLLFAIAKIGAVAVPLNTRLTSEELSYQITDSEMSMLIYEYEFHITVQTLKNKHPQLTTRSIESVTLPPLQETYISHDFPIIDASTPYIICYTSGTTGRPKGAVLTQENMFWNAVNNCTSIDINSNDSTLVLLPLFHIGGIGLFAFPTFFAGGAVAILGKFDPKEALNMIEKEQISVIMGVPTIFDTIRKHNDFMTANLSSVRIFCSGGAPCPKELIEFYLHRGLPFYQGYGLTEASPTVFMLAKEDYKRKIGSVGKPVLYTDINIVDENNNPVVVGEIGELAVKGPNVIKEYWQLPAETNQSIKDGWFYTGDYVKADEDGFIYIIGRKKEMIISGGENVYPLEIEQVLKEDPAVDEVSVIGVSDEKWGEVPFAFIVVKDKHVITEEQLKQACLSKLAKYKIPKSFVILSELPKNAAGKVDKKQLKALLTNVSKGE